MYGLTNKEIIELRIKCLKPYVETASKAGIEKDQVIQHAEAGWQFAIKTLEEEQAKTTAKRSKPYSSRS